MDWFNNWLFLAPIGNIPSAEDEEPYYAMLDDTPVAALFEPKGTDNPGAVQLSGLRMWVVGAPLKGRAIWPEIRTTDSWPARPQG